MTKYVEAEKEMDTGTLKDEDIYKLGDYIRNLIYGMENGKLPFQVLLELKHSLELIGIYVVYSYGRYGSFNIDKLYIYHKELGEFMFQI